MLLICLNENGLRKCQLTMLLNGFSSNLYPFAEFPCNKGTSRLWFPSNKGLCSSFHAILAYVHSFHAIKGYVDCFHVIKSQVDFIHIMTEYIV